jgi:hypothetical protein
MKIVRIVSAVVFCAFLFGSLTSCGNNSGGTSTPTFVVPPCSTAAALPTMTGGNWTGTWTDTRYGVSGSITMTGVTQGAGAFTANGTIDVSSAPTGLVGLQAGTVTGVIAPPNVITFTFTSATVGSGSGTLTGTCGTSTAGNVTAGGLGAFTFSGTASDTAIIGTFAFTSPTGGYGTISMAKM